MTQRIEKERRDLDEEFRIYFPEFSDKLLAILP